MWQITTLGGRWGHHKNGNFSWTVIFYFYSKLSSLPACHHFPLLFPPHSPPKSKDLFPPQGLGKLLPPKNCFWTPPPVAPTHGHLWVHPPPYPPLPMCDYVHKFSAWGGGAVIHPGGWGIVRRIPLPHGHV